jgi:mRNA interferase RelE/StbE
MPYQVVVPRPVQRQLDNLHTEAHERVIRRILALKDDPRPPGSVKLRGMENEYRIRVGDYRVRYEVRDAELLVILLHCGHRRDVYGTGNYQ